MIKQSYATEPDAIEACESIGGHLITNDEWMTLARNIEMVPENWSSGVIGSGYIYSGHNDRDPARALEASIDDTDSYYGTNNTTGNQRRTLTLTNGQIIWDLPGNVWEWTDDIIDLSINRPISFNNSGDIITTTDWYNYFLKDPDTSAIGYIKYDNLGSTTLKYKDYFY
jgi:phosphatidylserine/phosphatidylglycerophosphate/cardiolipin synthase-like enzyme